MLSIIVGDFTDILVGREMGYRKVASVPTPCEYPCSLWGNSELNRSPN